MYLISYSIYICTVAIIHLEIYHNLKKKKKTFVYSFSFFSLFSMHRYETISIFLFLDKDLDFLIPTHSRRLTISFFVKKEMLMDDLRILVSKKN